MGIQAMHNEGGFQLYTKSFFLPIANEDKNRMGDDPPPFFKNLP